MVIDILRKSEPGRNFTGKSRPARALLYGMARSAQRPLVHTEQPALPGLVGHMAPETGQFPLVPRKIVGDLRHLSLDLRGPVLVMGTRVAAEAERVSGAEQLFRGGADVR